MNLVLTRLAMRDLRKVLSIRTLLIWGTLAGLGVFFFFATSGKTTLMDKNEVDFMAVFLPQIIFGAWAVLSIYFDLVSSDRQHNVLDCILCSGVSKRLIYCGKMITLVGVSLVLSFAYLLPVTVVIIMLSGGMEHSAVLVEYLLPLWGYIMVYASLGMAISVIARSSKVALIASLASGLILMPRFFMLFVDGLGAAFDWTQQTKDSVSLISPGIMMERLAHYSNNAEYTRMALIFCTSILLLLAIGYIIFYRQDELNYGE